MSVRLPRRDFLKTTGALGAGFWLGTSNSPSRAAAANELLNIAVIGPGGQGSGNLSKVKSENIVAICDVDDVRAGKAFENNPKAEKFADFRQMFDKLEKQIDAVVISTPDHTHFHPSYWAMTRGKHVYLEKPMAHSVWEARELTKLAAEKKVATQLGVQRHTLPDLRAGVEIVKNGVIGQIQEVHSWIGSNRGMKDGPTDGEVCPSTLKWDLWLGPAAERPYSKAFAPYNWRFWWDFGTGEAGNWGCHVLDIPFWALDLKYPTKVSGSGPSPDPQKTPTSMATTFEFPDTSARPAVKLHWYQGTPPIIKEKNLNASGVNNLFIGTEGMLLCGFGNYRLLPEEKFKGIGGVKNKLESIGDFHKNWLAACKGGPAAACDFNYSGPMSETVLLANVAYRVQGSFDWDHANLKTVGNPAAQQLIRTEFRKGWEIS